MHYSLRFSLYHDAILSLWLVKIRVTCCADGFYEKIITHLDSKYILTPYCSANDRKLSVKENLIRCLSLF